MKPTNEQLEIIETAKTGVNLAISAYAGAAKTTTCRMIAEELPKRSLYIAFNKAIAEEAKNKFPAHVECRTLHSLAYEQIVKGNRQMQARLKPNLDSREIIKLFEKEFAEEKLNYKSRAKTVRKLREVLAAFCQSAEKEIYTFGKPLLAGSLYKDLKIRLEDEEDIDLEYIEEWSDKWATKLAELWDNLINPNSNLTINHDIYLKLYQLNNITLHNVFKVIYLDEAQDSNDLTLDIVFRCKEKGTQIILVGDTFQSIYAWRGAVNAFDKIPKDFVKKSLTTSFRFHEEIASNANAIISKLGATEEVKGAASKETYFDRSEKAILCRTNAGVLAKVVEAFSNGEKIYCTTDFNNFFKALYHGLNLMNNKEVKFPYTPFEDYEDWEMFCNAQEMDSEVNQVVSYCVKYGNRLYEVLNQAKSVISKELEPGMVTITTMHKSKGLEWNIVEIYNDFLKPKTEEKPELFRARARETLHKGQLGELLYVAVTRAKQELKFPEELSFLIGE